MGKRENEKQLVWIKSSFWGMEMIWYYSLWLHNFENKLNPKWLRYFKAELYDVRICPYKSYACIFKKSIFALLEKKQAPEWPVTIPKNTTAGNLPTSFCTKKDLVKCAFLSSFFLLILSLIHCDWKKWLIHWEEKEFMENGIKWVCPGAGIFRNPYIS